MGLKMIVKIRKIMRGGLEVDWLSFFDERENKNCKIYGVINIKYRLGW